MKPLLLFLLGLAVLPRLGLFAVVAMPALALAVVMLAD